jgi:hypothetical protein
MAKAATMALLGITLASMPAFSTCVAGGDAPAPPVAAGRSSAETQFAVRYCYSQYKNQTDALVCLARLVR